MIVFWVVAGVLAAAAAGLVLQRAASAAREDAFDPTRDLYRRQLAEIDELGDRGLIAETERRSAQAEAGRRLLRAAEAPQAEWRAGGDGRRFLLAAIGAASALAVGVYGFTGAIGVPDQPFARRLAAWRSADPASLSAPELAAVLTGITRERPGDVEALRFLAIAQEASQAPAEAVRTLRRAVRAAPDHADLWEMLGEALMSQASGEVTPGARRAFQEALKRDPTLPGARFQLARLQVEGGDKAAGLAAWRRIAAELPASDPRRQAVLASITEAEAPANAQAETGRLAMIQGMVEGLAARLGASPDDPDGWVRLVRAYAVLGENPKRDDALRQARTRYAAKPEILARLEAAAQAEPMRPAEPSP
jgi:cytochrome c-type biogenesis protein CcmH